MSYNHSIERLKRSVILWQRQIQSLQSDDSLEAAEEIGYMVADKLGIKLYDKEMLQRAAQDSGICEELFESHDEKPSNSFLYSLVMDTYSMGYSGKALMMICQLITRSFWHSLMQLKK